jgi:DNA-directed RNA polymerase subunit RPC12/RpoP
MKRHYLHLSVYRCGRCHGPVVTGSVALRQNEISKETEQKEIGAICLSCGSRQSAATESAAARHLMPIEWPPLDTIKASKLTTGFVAALNRAELH